MWRALGDHEVSVTLGIDIGTSGTKTLAIDEKGTILGSASAEYPCSHPHPGWSEQDPGLWWDATVKTLKSVLGTGKFNAPGGRIEPGETPEAAAVRETQEELCVTPTGLRPAGRLYFAFVDGYSLDCHVFTAEDAVGCATETAEAVPFWCAENAIPFGEMWADDRIWMPLLLEQRPFELWSIFDNDLMLWHELRVAPLVRM